jgi:hypothetical protein
VSNMSNLDVFTVNLVQKNSPTLCTRLLLLLFQ